MTRPRSSLISVTDTPWYHVVSRCVRRAFLCGDDAHSGQNFDHRREWIVEWLLRLAAVFSIDVAAYAVMSNHYHIIMRVDVKRAETWSVEEVLQRWTQLFSGPVLVQRYLSPARDTMTEAEILRVEQFAADYRERLVNISWFMRILNENIARQANQEDKVKGHFWESRFKSQALLDETALLSAMAYVDLNPIRAGMAFTPETSDLTSIQARIRAMAEDEQVTIAEEPETLETVTVTTDIAVDSDDLDSATVAEAEDDTNQETTETANRPLRKPSLLTTVPTAPLMAFDATGQFEPAIPFGFDDYLELVDTVGRVIRADKRGAIPVNTPKILTRLNIDTEVFIEHASRFLKEFGHAVGRPEALVAHAAKRQAKYLRGMRTARTLCERRAA